MLILKIEGLHRMFDGEYPLDASYFTNRELHLIKQISGVRAGELEEALAADDSDLVVAVTLIAAKRAGKDIPVDLIWDAPAGKITLRTDAPDTEGDGEADPPAPSPTEEEPSKSGDGKSEPSGGSSADVLALHPSGPSLTGPQHSDTGAASG